MEPQTVLDLFSEGATNYFERCKATAVRLCLEKGSTNSDEVQRAHPKPQYVSRNAMASIFRDKNTFERAGTVPSTRLGAKGHYIGVYRLVNTTRVEHDAGR